MSAAFDPVPIAPGLWRWTARHPDWRPGAAVGSPSDWEAEVGCVLCELDGHAAFIDALVPDDAERFWDWADERVSAATACSALTTISFHRRSRDRLVERYGAEVSRARDRLPEGMRTIVLPGAGEVAFWLEPFGALVVGDRLLGDPAGGLRLCPQSWLGYLPGDVDHDRLREILAPLLGLKARSVLVSHGQPVLEHGDVALREALA